MRRTWTACILLTLAVTTLTPAPGSAQTKSQEQWCDGEGKASDDPDLVIRACTAIIKLGRKSRYSLGDAYHNRGMAHKEKREYDDAIADFDQSLRIESDASTYCERAFAYASKKDYVHANADANRAVKAEPRAIGCRADVFVITGELDKAIADLNMLLKNDPSKSAGALYVRGVAKLKKGDTVGGKADIAAAKKIQSDIADEVEPEVRAPEDH